MQYILTQAEYDHLVLCQQNHAIAKREALQKLCTDAANHIPIVHEWAPNDPPAPWGCILDESGNNRGGYCDECPAQKICPHDGKEFSQ